MTDAQRASYIDRIRRLPTELAQAIEGLSEEQLDTPYGEGKWTIRQVVNHVADSHTNGFSRMKMVVTEERPTLKPYDQDAWAVLPDTSGHNPAAALKTLEGLHERWAVFLEHLDAGAFERKAHHPDEGDLSLADLLVDYAEHGTKHIGHIMGLRKARGW